MTIQFAKAVKYEAKGRVALIGPAGSGKSYTALVLARLLAGPKGRIAAVDTEHGSLSKYADLFDFDVVNLESYSPDNFLAALKAAEAAKYDVFLADSLSHFWMGKDGALEFVDTAKKRSSSRDDMSGWKEFRPHERAMVDAMIGSSCHIVCTMRTKTAYEEQVNERTGKKQRVKIGLAPVQREGLEYEFDMVGLMDDDNTLIVDKTRCSYYAGKALQRPKDEDFAPFRDWLSGAAPKEVAAPAANPAPASGPQPEGAKPKSGPAPQQSGVPLPKLNGNVLTAHVNDVQERTSRNGGKPFIAVKIAGKLNGKDMLTCWHMSQADALMDGKGQLCQFEVEDANGWLNVLNVLAVGDQEYRDGKPYSENFDADPVPSGQPNPGGFQATLDDLPF